MSIVVVGSPPYATEVIRERDIGKPGFTQGATQGKHSFDAYGVTDGQLGALPPGTLEETLMSIAVVGSPPYADAVNANGEGPGMAGNARQRAAIAAGSPTERAATSAHIGYGTTPGQLGALPPGTLDAPPQPTTPAPVTTWQGCYSDGWQDLIVPEAFSHPAKFARGLIHRIYRHLIERGYVQAGTVVLDPFGGVGLGALDALTYGLHYIGVELEPRFVTLAQQNMDLWRQRYGFSGGTVVQGDSRQLRSVLAGAQVGAVVGSPPYAEQQTGGGIAISGPPHQRTSGMPAPVGYVNQGTTPGQLGAMPPGQVVCVVGSPPFAESLHLNESVEADIARMVRNGVPVTGGAQSRAPVAAHHANQGYGTTPGQLGAMPPGTVISSPPYAGAGEVLGTHNGIDWSKAQEGGKVATPARQASGEGYGRTEGQLGAMSPGAVVSSPPFQACLHQSEGGMLAPHQQAVFGRDEGAASVQARSYGTSPEQLGNASGDTFWAASAQIMAELSALLPPGAVCAWVLKAYVSKGKIVPFPQQWQALCEAHGFVLVEEIHASLVEHHGTQEGLFGGPQVVTTEKKSFFRRLAEKKGSPRIDYETVLIVRKAGDDGGVCVVGSPPYAEGWHRADSTAITEARMRKAGYSDEYIAQQFRASRAAGGNLNAQDYGTTPGNLGTMPVERMP